MDRQFRRWRGIIFLLPFLALCLQGERIAPLKIFWNSEEPVYAGGPPGISPEVPPARHPLPSLWDLAENIAFEHGLSPRLVKSIILAESNGDPQKVSARGARGLMQLMPLVTREYRVSDPHDPVSNIRGGVLYFKNLLEEFSGDVILALAAYNAGPGAVRRYGGVPPFRETREFVRKVTEIFEGEESIHFSPLEPKILLEAMNHFPRKFLVRPQASDPFSRKTQARTAERPEG